MRFFVYSLLFVFCISCGGGTKNPALKAPAKKTDSVNRVELVSKTFFRDSTVDFTARYIAGLPQLCKNGFSVLEQNTFWKNYQKTADKNWEKLYHERLDSIAKWEKEYLSQQVNDSLTLFYPFSGPDFVHAVTLYPRTTKYILCALEPVIDLPDLLLLNDDNRKLFLESLENSLRDVYGKSYFITTHMQDDFKRDKARGVLPVLYVFLARTGHEILESHNVAVDSLGNIHDTLLPKRGTKMIPGVRFRFRVNAGNEMKELYYFSADISNKGLKYRKGLLGFLDQQKNVNTYIKSASYMLHYSTFSEIRNKIISISASVLQDDTGIPYKYFKAGKSWKTVLFGEYIRPVKDFGDYLFQDDLDSAYQHDKNILQLPFHLGYHYTDKKQSHQLFIRRL